jgi:PqqD family protein of HPr-rel-A system
MIKPKVRGDLTVVELDGEAVIYDERTSDLHHLNPTATIVFGLCDGTATMPEIATDIAEAFGVPAAEVEAQVRSLVRRFRAAELLEPRAGSRARVSTGEARISGGP